MDESWRIKELENRKTPDRWFAHAESLKRAAEVLLEHAEATYPDGEPVNVEDYLMRLQLPAMLLLGYAVELGIKGFLLQRQVRQLGHDLVILFGLTGLPLTAKQQWLLKKLTEHTVWAGRYPLPKREQDFKLSPGAFSQDEDVEEFPPLPFTVEDPTQAYALIDELLRASSVTATK